MLTVELSLRRMLGLALGCFVASQSTLLPAQISLQPTAPVLPRDQYEPQTRQRPVSRSVNDAARDPANISSRSPSLYRSDELEQPVSSAGSDREYEFAQLQREANILERQFSLVRRIVKFTSPSIVHIEATKLADPGNGLASSKIEEAGAGIVIEVGGRPYVMTNRHVIHPADLSSIRLELNNGKLLRATDVWTDPSTDVALIAISNSDVVPAVLGNSDNMDVGDFVVAVGSPFGLSHSVTYGILSAKGRRNLELGSREIQIQDFFQTDAAINPGNSGGPLINLHGEIIGINTAIASNSGGNEGIGFTIPINLAVTVAEQLVRRGRMTRSYLGVQLENAFDIFTARRLGLNSTDGALVKVVIPNSPADEAGLKVGDVIVEFNGQRIENDGHLVERVGLTPVGSHVSMTIYRLGKVQRVSALLRPNPAG